MSPNSRDYLLLITVAYLLGMVFLEMVWLFSDSLAEVLVGAEFRERQLTGIRQLNPLGSAFIGLWLILSATGGWLRLGINWGSMLFYSPTRAGSPLTVDSYPITALVISVFQIALGLALIIAGHLWLKKHRTFSSREPETGNSV